MGCCSSSTTTTTKTAPLSDRGESYDSLFQQLLLDALGTYGGYEVNPVQTTKYQDEGKAKDLQNRIAEIDKQIAAGGGGAPGNTGIVPPGMGDRGGGGPTGPGQMGGTSQLQAEKARLQAELDGLPKSTYTDFNLKKGEDPRVKAAIDRYGANSPEVDKVRESVKVDAQQKLEATAGIERDYLKNLQKMMAGDYSYSPEQEKQISSFIDPIRNTITRTTNDLLSQYGQSDKMLRDSLLDLSKEVDKTGYDVLDALKASEIQIEKSGLTLMDTLKGVNESARARASFEFDLMSQQADQQAAQQSALLGLPPGSQSERYAAQKMKTDALKTIQLELSQREAQGALSIQGNVEEGKKQISLSRVALAQSQGAKKEDIAKMGFGLTEMLTQKNESAIGNKANAEIALEQQKQQMLYGAAFGNIPQILGAGQAGLSFEKNMSSADLAKLQALMGPVAQQLGVEQQRSFAESTVTQKKKPSFLDAFTQLVGAGSSVAGAVLGMPGLGGGGGGGGSGAMTSYGPSGPGGAGAGIDLSVYKPVAAAVPAVGSGLSLGR